MMFKEKGWDDRLYLVNPKGGEMHGMHVYKRVSEVPDALDLAIVIVPAPSVPGVLEELGSKGIRHVIIESAGFAETGDKGRVLQDEVKRILLTHGMRAIGPNCVGIVNTDNSFTTTETIEEAFTPGNVAIIAQSGVFGNILLDKLHLRGVFISKAVTLGNRIDVNEIEMLDYFHQDKATRVVMMYLEGAADGKRLTDALSKISIDKPVLVLKSGRTPQGMAATVSHTGSLSGEDSLYAGMFVQTGVTRVESLDELVEFTGVFASQPLPKGPRLGIVTGSGSMGALATDTAITSGLEVPPPSLSVVDEIKKSAPEWMNVKNPLDVGPSGLFKEALSAMVKDPEIDMVMAILTFPHKIFREFLALGIDMQDMYGHIDAIGKLSPDKPLVVCVVGHDEFSSYISESAGPDIPVLHSPEMTVKALAALWRYSQWKKKILG